VQCEKPTQRSPIFAGGGTDVPRALVDRLERALTRASITERIDCVALAHGLGLLGTLGGIPDQYARTCAVSSPDGGIDLVGRLARPDWASDLTSPATTAKPAPGLAGARPASMVR